MYFTLLSAGGLWNWCTPAVNYEQMLSTGLPALRACMESGVREVLATAWGMTVRRAESARCCMGFRSMQRLAAQEAMMKRRRSVVFPRFTGRIPMLFSI